ERVVTPLPISIVARRVLGEIQAAHRRMPNKAVRDAASLQNGAHPVSQPRSILRNPLKSIGLGEDFQRLFSGGERDRMRGIGSAMSHALADLAHDVLAPGED